MAVPRDYRLINACIAAYHIDDNGNLDPHAPGYGQIGLKGPPQGFVAGELDIDACFVGETTDNYVILAFRGTRPPTQGGNPLDWILDWLQDFELGPTPWLVNGKSYGQVEGGFAAAMLALWPRVKLALDKIDLKSKAGFWITGHSKGGSLTALAATLVAAAYPGIAPQIVAFAPAMACDEDFQTLYENQGLDDATLRYQNECDIVPYMPVVFTAKSAIQNAQIIAGVLARAKGTTLAKISLLEYEPLGSLDYIDFDESTGKYSIVTGWKGEIDGIAAIASALLHGQFSTIVEAHAASGGYLECFGIPTV